MVSTAIKSILKTASIKANIFGLYVPRNRGSQWVILTYISNVPNPTKAAVSTLDKTRWQFDCYAKEETVMDALGESVRTALDNYSDTVEGVNINRITFEGESDTVESIGDEGATEHYYRRTQEYSIMIKP